MEFIDPRQSHAVSAYDVEGVPPICGAVTTVRVCQISLPFRSRCPSRRGSLKFAQNADQIDGGRRSRPLELHGTSAGQQKRALALDDLNISERPSGHVRHHLQEEMLDVPG
jgi:hypothetical protein